MLPLHQNKEASLWVTEKSCICVPIIIWSAYSVYKSNYQVPWLDIDARSRKEAAIDDKLGAGDIGGLIAQ
jgi:hypothetical protein